MKPSHVFRDKFLPTQPILREHYQGDDESLLTALYEAVIEFSGVRLPTEDFTVQAPPDFPPESNMSNVALLQVLQFVVRLKQPQRILEIGTFLGLSAMCLAAAQPPAGRLVTIEKFDRFAELARRNIAANGFAERIEVLQGDAFEILRQPGWAGGFDLIFLDGNKEKYDAYFELLDPLLPPGGVLVVDDIFFQGDALNPVPTTEKGQGTRRFMELARAHPGYDRAVLPIGDGVMLMLKRGAA